MTVPVPDGMDWYIWRVLTSKHIHVTLTELKTTWSLMDLVEAHDALDLMEALDRKARQRAEADAERNK